MFHVKRETYGNKKLSTENNLIKAVSTITKNDPNQTISTT